MTVRDRTRLIVRPRVVSRRFAPGDRAQLVLEFGPLLVLGLVPPAAPRLRVVLGDVAQELQAALERLLDDLPLALGARALLLALGVDGVLEVPVRLVDPQDRLEQLLARRLPVQRKFLP